MIARDYNRRLAFAGRRRRCGSVKGKRTLLRHSGAATDGNGVFASSQYWYESYGAPCPNRSDHGMACNSAGYMGSQVMRGKGGQERHVFIFSCWDAEHRSPFTTIIEHADGECRQPVLI